MKQLSWIFLMGAFLTQSQLTAQIDSTQVTYSCGWQGESLLYLKDFRSVDEAEEVTRRVMNHVGISPNFEIQAAKVPNAAAVVYKNRQYIFYNPDFIQNVYADTETDWAAISIMAHEIGHHLSGHTLLDGGSQPEMEIEADEFTGFVLRKMGATLEEAQVAMRRLASPFGSKTHPPREERLSAIEIGWSRADQQIARYFNQNKQFASNTTPADEMSSGNTAPAPKPEKKKIDAPAFATYQVFINSNPNSVYYITKSNTFVTIRDGKVSQLGKLEYNNDPTYPYKIDFYNEELGILLINRKGELFTQKMRLVGNISRVNHEKKVLAFVEEFAPDLN